MRQENKAHILYTPIDFDDWFARWFIQPIFKAVLYKSGFILPQFTYNNNIFVYKKIETDFVNS